MKKLALIALIGGFALMANASNASAACGTFEVSKGDVKVETKGKAVAAAVGSKICSGDAVIAGANSRAKIKMEDGNELNISPDSKIVLENYQFNAADNKKKVLLNVLKGKIRATTKEENMYNDKAKDGQANTFQVKTKAAVAGVRGTDFLSSYNPKTNSAQFITFKGTVEVGRLGPGGAILNSVQVTAGMKTEASAGNAPAVPKMIPAVELQEINTNSTADNLPPSAQPPAPGSAANDGKSDKGPAQPERSPASNNGGSGMLNSNDLGGATTPKESVGSPNLPKLPVVTAAPTPPNVPRNDFVDRIIQNGPAKVNVKICVKRPDGSTVCP